MFLLRIHAESDRELGDIGGRKLTLVVGLILEYCIPETIGILINHCNQINYFKMEYINIFYRSVCKDEEKKKLYTVSRNVSFYNKRLLAFIYKIKLESPNNLAI